MKSSVLTIARKELARFFSNKTSAIVSIVLPGLLIFAMWTFMGDAMGSMFKPDEGKVPTLAAINQPESMKALEEGTIAFVAEAELPSAQEMRARIEQGDVKAFIVFPANFDEAVSVFDPASENEAPQVEIYYNSVDPNSSNAYRTASALLDAYESSLSNRFDVNREEGSFDVAEERDVASTMVVSIAPLMLLILLFTSCMSIAAESVAGEKERGTMATLLATPINRRDIALGKVLAITLIALLIALSSTIGIFAGLPNIAQGAVDINVYGVGEYALLALVIISMAMLIVMAIMVVSTLAKSVKEASMYMTPLMIIVMVVGVSGMFGGGAQTDMQYYVIPLYSSVQCMIAIFSFDFQPVNVALCIVSNVVYTGIGVIVLQRMFNSERLMFAR